MVAGQLCAFDDRNDWKSKLVQKKSSWYGCSVGMFYENFGQCFVTLSPRFNGDACQVKISQLNSRNKNNWNFHQVKKCYC